MPDSYPRCHKPELAEKSNLYQPDRSESRATRSRYLILVVDDVEQNVFLITRVLEKMGYRHGQANNGREAVNAVAEGGYDLVLMDCHMPVMDGAEATAMIRCLPAPRCHIPVIAVTANIAPDNVTRCFDAGMNDFMIKPLDFVTVDTLILKWVGAGETAFQEGE